MRILITGGNGQLGSEFRNLAKNYSEFKFFFTDVHDCDLTSKDSVRKYFSENSFDCIINCAAYTAVDDAEKEKFKAKKLNVEAVENILFICKKFKMKLIHISTDYVFNGNKTTPYTEKDNTNPLGVYGKTKLEGEKKIYKSDIDAVVIRTSWLYSHYGKNFLKTMIRLSNEKSEISVVNDQYGCPTYALDLANACLKIISLNGKISEKSKLYHYSNEGSASWYDFAKKIFELKNIKIKLNPVDSSTLNIVAERPKYSVFDKHLIQSHFNIKIPKWQNSLKKCLINF